MKCGFTKSCPISTSDNKELKELSEKICITNCQLCARLKIRRLYGPQAIPCTLLPDGNFTNLSVFYTNNN